MRNPFTMIGNLFKEILKNDPDIDENDYNLPRRPTYEADLK